MRFRFLLLLAVLTPCAVAQDAPSPSLVSPTPRIDLGRVLKGAQVTQAFRLENRGTRPLALRSTQASCDCTAAPLAVTSLAPGQGTDLRVTFDSSKFEGHVQHTIVVHSDDPARPALVLALEAHVVDRWTLAPATLSLGTVSRYRPLEARIRVTRNDGVPPVVRSAAVPGDPRFRVEVVPLPDQVAVEVVVRLPAGLPVGALRTKLLVALEDPDHQIREIPLLGQLSEEVTVLPDRLDLGTLTPGAPAPAPLRLILHRPDLELTAVEVQPAWLSAMVTPRKLLPGTAAQPGATIQLRVGHGAPPGVFKGHIRIRTSSGDQPEVVVPLSGVVGHAGP